MVSAISTFFQSIFNDSLTKFIQPTYLTTAFIFVLLNFMFIYPDMVAHNVIYIIYLNDINPVIQAILVAAIVLILAYVLLSLNSYFLAFLTGELWCESLIGRTLIWFKRIEASSTSTSPARRLFIECKQLLEKTKSHPSSLDVQTDEPKFPGPPSPTPLGDVMSYPVSLAVAPTGTCLSNQRTANNTSVTVTVNNVTANVASTFTGQLSSAIAIYLIQK